MRALLAAMIALTQQGFDEVSGNKAGQSRKTVLDK